MHHQIGAIAAIAGTPAWSILAGADRSAVSVSMPKVSGSPANGRTGVATFPLDELHEKATMTADKDLVNAAMALAAYLLRLRRLLRRPDNRFKRSSGRLAKRPALPAAACFIGTSAGSASRRRNELTDFDDGNPRPLVF